MKKNDLNISDGFMVSVSFSNEKSGVLVVGKKNGNNTVIVNAFQGEEAWELYKKLTEKKSTENVNNN